MKSSKITFLSRSQSNFQTKFITEYLWYGILLAFVLFFLGNGIINSGVDFINSFILGAPKYGIGSEVQLEGQIGLSSHNDLLSFRDTRGVDRSLKSKNLDINRYKGKGVIYGTITDSSIDGSFVVDVSKIYQVISNETPNIVKKYMDIDFGLQIDLSDSPNHFVDLDSDNAVLIKDLRTFRTVMKIRSFLCDRRVDNTNCGKIVWEGEVQKKYDNFISLQSLNFFKLNQKERFVDDKQGRGYQITVTDDNTMYQLSEYIGLLGKDWIGGKIYDRLSSLCTNNEFTMTQSESFELKKSNNNWFAIIKGKSDKGETIQCEIYLDDSSKQGVNFELINILPL